MRFASRQQAGECLGAELDRRGLGAECVLGLPRGGVIVAAAVAQVLRASLDVLVVRKVGHPQEREFAVGALAEGQVLVLDEPVLKRLGVSPEALRMVVLEERERLGRYEKLFHWRGLPGLEAQRVLLVDDGLATGATMEAAVAAVRQRKASWIGIGAPVASVHAVARLQKVADALCILHVDRAFDAVGHYYQDFSQTSDQEVLELLEARSYKARS